MLKSLKVSSTSAVQPWRFSSVNPNFFLLHYVTFICIFRTYVFFVWDFRYFCRLLRHVQSSGLPSLTFNSKLVVLHLFYIFRVISWSLIYVAKLFHAIHRIWFYFTWAYLMQLFNFVLSYNWKLILFNYVIYFTCLTSKYYFEFILIDFPCFVLWF